MPPALDPQTAVLLMAHGSRRADANADLEELARRVREQGGYALIEISYLELAEPSIPQGGRNCVARGANRVLMLPYFLSAGRHVTEDLQGFQRQLAEEFPTVAFELCPPLGLHPLMTQIVLDRLLESSL
jgi:sirohydrochlorin ferrochelatase